MARQSDQYAGTNPIDYVADFPGADPANDVIHVQTAEEATVEIDSVVTVDQIEEIVEITTGEALDVSAATVPTEQQSPVGIENKNGVQIDPLTRGDHWPIDDQTTSVGASNAAQLALGPHRKAVDVFYDVSGAATVSLEVSTDGATWRQLHAEALDAAGSDILQFETAYQYIRAYADQNLNTLEIASKGN